MSLNVNALRESFEAVKPSSDKLTEVFYATLFERYPEVKPLFENVEMEEQRKKLFQALALVVRNLEKPDVLAGILEQMGRRHVDYGALPEHYPAVGECLLHALATVAGPLWNDELNQAWTDAYGAIADLMLKGAAQPV